MNALNKEGPERQEIEALLPWHAAGTLNRRDSERVERAIAADRELARRFQLVREEQHETIHLNESLGVPSTRAMEKLFAAIEAEGAKTPARRPFDLAGRISSFLSSLAPRTLAYAAAAAAIALFVQAAVLTTIVVKDGSQATGGSVDLASAPTNANYHAVVRFTPQATAADVTRLLSAYNATVVDGPGRGGLYNIRFNGVDKGDVDKTVQRMQAETRIVEFIASKE
jgi:anti-sigma-K factor RskA